VNTDRCTWNSCGKPGRPFPESIRCEDHEPAKIAARSDAAETVDLLDELLDVIVSTIDNWPRSQQIAVGPSDLGMPCTRRLAYKLANTPPTNVGQPAWKPTVGTAIHAWLEDAFGGSDRWVTERRVCVGQVNGVDIAGSADLYDRRTRTVIDWKSCGPTRLKHYHAHGPGAQYRAQAHLYGRGYEAWGLPVSTVMIVFLPRNGELREAFAWSEPYDEQIALDALSRAAHVATALAALGPDVFAALPTDPADCAYCQFRLNDSTDLAVGCPGDPSRATRRDSLTSLVAKESAA
jgi:hypothetical protein